MCVRGCVLPADLHCVRVVCVRARVFTSRSCPSENRPFLDSDVSLVKSCSAASDCCGNVSFSRHLSLSLRFFSRMSTPWCDRGVAVVCEMRNCVSMGLSEREVARHYVCAGP